MQKSGFLTLGASDDNLMGLFFVSWAVVGAYVWVASMARGNYALAAALLGAAATLVVLGIAYYADSSPWFKVGGWVGIVTAGLAWYASAATATNHTLAPMILPTHRMPFGTDIARIERHPGHLV